MTKESSWRRANRQSLNWHWLVYCLLGFALAVGLHVVLVSTNVSSSEYRFAIWQVAAFGIGGSFVWLVRIGGEFMKLEPPHLPKAHDPINKKPVIAAVHGIIERLLFGLLAIPFFAPNHHGKPDTTSIAALLVAASLYLTLRERSAAVERSEPSDSPLSIYSTWNMGVSIALGIFGGWVYWYTKSSIVPF